MARKSCVHRYIGYGEASNCNGEASNCNGENYKKYSVLCDAYWDICGRYLQDGLYNTNNGYSEPFPKGLIPDQTENIKEGIERYYDRCVIVSNMGKEEFTKGILKKCDEYKKDARQFVKNKYLDMLESIVDFLGEDYVKAELGFKCKK